MTVAPRRVIVGISGYELTIEEKALLKEYAPLGVILFARNIQSETQLKQLTDDIKSTLAHEMVHISVDQEGGHSASRLSGLMETENLKTYSASIFRKIHEKIDPSLVSGVYNALYQQAVITSYFAVVKCGINMIYAPPVDILYDDTNEVLVNRCYGKKAEAVIALTSALLEGVTHAGGCMWVLKHAPGLGAGITDTHLEMTKITRSIEELLNGDFLPFANQAGLCNHIMVSHAIYDALDPDAPASVSAKVMRFIRDNIHYANPVIISDSLDMKGLAGKPSEKVRNVLDAGYDIALYGNYDNTDQLKEILQAAYPVNELSVRRIFSCYNAAVGDGSGKCDAAEISKAAEELQGYIEERL